MPPGDETPAAAEPGGRRLGSVNAVALMGVFAAEFALFWVCTGRHFAWAFPRWFDQLQYLREAYASYDAMRAHGFAAGARNALGNTSPQGSLHGFFALVVFCIAGPTRTAALSVNLFAFLALQASTFVAVRRISRSWAPAWAAAGFLAAAHSPWSASAGSASDFRLDWMAACAYGVALSAAVSGNGFRSMRWAFLFGVAVGVALLTRHLTAVYFGFIYAGMAAWLVFRPGGWRRCGRLALSGLCAAAISAWAFWRSWPYIYSYYWVDRFVGPEGPLRDSHMNLLSYIMWMGSELLFHQLGIAAALIGIGSAAVLFASGAGRPERNRPSAGTGEDGRGAWPVVVAFLAAPVVVLLFHPEKAPQPLNIMIPGLTWVFVLAWMRLSRRANRAAVVATCAAVGSAGAALFAWAQLRSPYTAEMVSGFRSVNAVSDYLYFRSEEAGLTRPRVAVTGVLDGLSAGAFEILGRERHQQLLHFVALLPTGLLGADPADVIKRLSDSDFVCLVTRAPPMWPFDRQLSAMLPETLHWCERNLKHDGDLETPEFSASIYERPSLPGPPSGTRVDLGSMVAAGARGLDYAPAEPPGGAFLEVPEVVPWSTRAELHYHVRSGYSPVRILVTDLPEGLGIEPGSAEIRGIFRQPGNYAATIVAANALGSSRKSVSFRVTDDEWNAEITPPAKTPADVPAQIGFSVFDTTGWLDFIDITDLTIPKVLVRLEANEDQRTIWQGSYKAAFHRPGRHTVILRFVRFDPGGKGTYSYIDREWKIDVAP
jgi:hypothetical protein